MNLETILVSAGVGVVTSVITAYITTRLKMREEKEKWRREFALKYAEVQATDAARAQRMAAQFAIGVLIFKQSETSERERIFVPPNCQLVAGRSSENPIYIADPNISKHHCAFNADDENVYVVDLGSTNASYLNGQLIRGACRLETGDIVSVGQTELLFHRLERA